MTNTDYVELFEKARKSPEFWATGITTDFAKALEDRINDMGLTKKQFAKKAGVKPSYLTRVMLASSNITALTMAKLALAANLKVNLRLTKLDDNVFSNDLEWSTQPTLISTVGDAAFNVHTSHANDEIYQTSELKLVAVA